MKGITKLFGGAGKQVKQYVSNKKDMMKRLCVDVLI